MLENVEFWGLFLPIVAGAGVQIKYLFDIREKLAENSERITKLETLTRLEFEKCNLHSCSWRDEE